MLQPRENGNLIAELEQHFQVVSSDFTVCQRDENVFELQHLSNALLCETHFDGDVHGVPVIRVPSDDIAALLAAAIALLYGSALVLGDMPGQKWLRMAQRTGP